MIDITQFTNPSPSGEPAGTIGMVCRDAINVATVMSLLNTRIPEPGVDRLMNVGSVLTVQRNSHVQHMRGEWLLFIDDDMVWEPDAVLRLVDRWRELRDSGFQPDIVGGLCFRRTPPHQPTMYVREQADSGPYSIIEDVWDRGVVEVDATGMAFALVAVSAFERIAGMPMPSYEERVRENRPAEFFRWQDNLGEDLRFCRDLKSQGGRIFVDTEIVIRHVYEHEVGPDDWARSLTQRTPSQLLTAAKINARFGVRVVSPEEARRHDT